jgi:hypothetical protein
MSNFIRPSALLGILCVGAALGGCGGVDVSSNGSATSATGATTTATIGTSTGKTSSSTSSSSSSSSSSGSSSSSSSGASSSSGSTSSTHGAGPAAALAAKLGVKSRLLIGLGAQGPAGVVSAVESEALHPDIMEQYLVGVGSGDWTHWNSPTGYFAQIVANNAEAVGAIPMYTLYQMAQNGDGNLSGLNSSSFMSAYWSNVKIMFQQIAVSGRPALVNFEPDFWGYVEHQSTNGDPSTVFAQVKVNGDCASLSNDVKGVAQCLIAMARKYAPHAYVGFPPAGWAGKTQTDVVNFMNAIGAQNADFIVLQALDRDAGCYEAGASYCGGGSGGFYWDETNATHPNFDDYFAHVAAYHTGIGNLPVVFWQIPEGVPSSNPGGSAYHYRDNRVHYFLTHPDELTAVGGLAVVFGTGEDHQTNITTDGGHFQQLYSDYLNKPALLP